METKQKRTKTAVSILVLAGLVVFALTAIGGNLEPSAPPGPTMKTLDEVEPRIPISSVPFTISQSGSYYLTGDLEAAYCGDHGIRIDANNVTIDLCGFSLYEPTFSCTYDGITVLNFHDNITICNGTIRGFGQDGVDLSNAKNCRLIDLRVFNNGQDGLSTGGASYISGCTVQSNGDDGIHAFYGSMVTGNIVYDNADVGIYAGIRTMVKGNMVYDNGGHGIYAGGSSMITGNTVCFNGGYGIRTAGYDCMVTSNKSRSNGAYGIYAYEGCTVIGNSVSNNSWAGILSLWGCTVTGNTARSNGDDGIYAYGSGTVIGNTAYYNQNHGIQLGGNCLVDQNSAYNNNQSGGGYSNIESCGTCTFGLNHAP